jgi:hypothetical protein
MTTRISKLDKKKSQNNKYRKIYYFLSLLILSFIFHFETVETNRKKNINLTLIDMIKIFDYLINISISIIMQIMIRNSIMLFMEIK